MAVSAKTVRAQLKMLTPRFTEVSLDTLRKGQNRVGDLMGLRFHREVMTKDHSFGTFPAAWVIPRDERRQGVILYLHGGGYTCGETEYAKGVGACWPRNAVHGCSAPPTAWLRKHPIRPPWRIA